MSRIGKQPVSIPEKVKVDVKPGNTVHVEGPKGKVHKTFDSVVKISVSDKKVSFAPTEETRFARAMFGTARSVVAGMVKGVSEGYTRQLEINGVGYRAEVTGSKLNLVVGLSHPVELTLPTGVAAKSEKAKSTVNPGQDAVLLTLSGSDKELIGQLASKIRSTRPPEPYKGKGIKYFEEKLKRKVGKTGAS